MRRSVPRTVPSASPSAGALSLLPLALLLVLVALPAAAERGEAAAGDSAAPRPPLTREQEIDLALSAVPAHLRPAAAVYVLGKEGYALAREGGNGVTCLVGRERPDTQEPICWDREGTETILPVALEEGRLRAQGLSEEAVEAKIAEGFARGTFRAPRRAGIAYMLSQENHVWNGRQVVHYFPHVMIYAPYVTNADIGSDGKSPWMPWVLREGHPHAYIMVVTRVDEEP